MKTVLLSHPSCAEHDMGPWHPEAPARLEAVLAALAGDAFRDLDRLEAPPGTREQVERVHRGAYVDGILDEAPRAGLRHLDPDTAMNDASGDAALRAVGAVCAAVDAVVSGAARNAFCAVRPPGHHAVAARAMGFCLFNNVAIAAEQARRAHGLERVAVVDFDVHHGNGTQEHCFADPSLFYASSHQWPAYPGTGLEDETGVAMNVCNARLAPNTGSPQFRARWRDRILPALDAFRPDLIVVSAGFDAHRDDPLAQLRLAVDDFAWVTREILEVAERRAGGRVVSALEGGYDLAALAASAAAHVRALMGH
jgi:acetoin utilization deacetylase AcuC-like enzyme